MSYPPTNSLAEYGAGAPWTRRARATARDLLLRGLAAGRRMDKTSGWIRFPYYHHIFEDERADFARQLDYLANFGDFITLGEAVAMIRGPAEIDGRFFCLTFDDGLKNCLDGAVPLLVERNISAEFYVVADLAGRSLPPGDPLAVEVFGFQGRDTTLDFMSWEDCRALIGAGMTVGSHGCSHARLSRLDRAAADQELGRSKEIIETETGAPCDHFCAPYGMPEIDFLPERDPGLARGQGYLSFASGSRGPSRAGDDPFALRRDHLLAGWGNYQLDYFFCKD